jgi:hypothetical protein
MVSAMESFGNKAKASGVVAAEMADKQKLAALNAELLGVKAKQAAYGAEDLAFKAKEAGDQSVFMAEKIKAAGLESEIMGTRAKMAGAQVAASAETGGAGWMKAAGMVTGAGLAIAAVGIGAAAASVELATKFQAATEMLHTQAGMVQSDIEAVRLGLIKMSSEVAIGPTELANGFYHIVSAATNLPPALRNVNSELDIYLNAVKLSKIGNADLEASTQAVVGVMAAYGREGMTAAEAAAELNAIVGSGDMRMQQLTAAMATGVLPAAQTFGLQLKDVGAALATLTDNVTPADEAATRLRMTFSLMGAPSGVAQKALGAIGISATELGNDMRQPNGLLVAVADLKTHLSQIDVSHFQGGIAQARKDLEHFGLSSAEVDRAVSKLGPTATEQALILSKAFGGGRSSAAIMTLLGEFDSFRDKYAAIEQGSSQFGDAWTKTTENFQFQSRQMSASLEAVGTAIGMAILPVLTKIMEKILPVIDAFSKWAAVHGDLLAAIVVGVAAFGLILTVLGVIAIAALVVTGPMLLIALAIGLLAAGAVLLISHWSQVSPFFRTLWNAVSGVFQQALAYISPLVREALAGIERWWKAHGDEVMQVVTFLWNIVSAIFSFWLQVLVATVKFWFPVMVAFLRLVFTEIIDVLKIAWDIISGVFTVYLDIVTGHWDRAWNDLKDMFVQIAHDIRNFFSDWVQNMLGLMGTLVSGMGNLMGNLASAMGMNMASGLNSVITALNNFIDVVDKLPGVSIGHLGAISYTAPQGWGRQGIAGGMASGGRIGAGFVTGGPTAIVGEGNQCVAEGVLIETANGPLPIECVQAGEKVLTRDGYRTVLWAGKTRRHTQVIAIRAGTCLVSCTPDHRVWSIPTGAHDAYRIRDWMGGRLIRGGGAFPYQPLKNGSPNTSDGVRDDRPGCGRALAGRRRMREPARSHEVSWAETDVRCDDLRTCQSPKSDFLTATLVRSETPRQGAGCAGSYSRAGREASPPGEILWTRATSLGGREYLREPERDSCLSPLQTQSWPTLDAPEARWIEAKDLRVGDWVWGLVTGELQAQQVTKIEAVTNRVDTYDLAVSEAHEFVAGGILVHNSYPEYVIPTDPTYRKNAHSLLSSLMGDIGVPGMQRGSLLGASIDPLAPAKRAAEGAMAGLGTFGGLGKTIVDQVVSALPGLIAKATTAFTGPTLTGATAGDWGGQCVTFAEKMLGIFWPVALASELSGYVNSQDAKPGEAAVFTGGPAGHVAVVLGTGNPFPVVDSNWGMDERIQYHMMSKSDYGFAGFINLHPGMASGGRLGAGNCMPEALGGILSADTGAVTLRPGMNAVYNGTGAPEALASPGSRASLEDVIGVLESQLSELRKLNGVPSGALAAQQRYG